MPLYTVFLLPECACVHDPLPTSPANGPSDAHPEATGIGSSVGGGPGMPPPGGLLFDTILKSAQQAWSAQKYHPGKEIHKFRLLSSVQIRAVGKSGKFQRTFPVFT